MTTEEKEAYVRSRWVRLFMDTHGDEWEIQACVDQHDESFILLAHSKTLVADVLWSIAYCFTINRVEEIRRVDEEIEWLRPGCSPDPISIRIGARLQNIRDELTEGMTL